MIWIFQIQGLSHLDQFWSFWKAFLLMGLRVCSFLPSFRYILNHLVELLQMFQPESSLSSPESSPSSPESLWWLIQEIAMITLVLSPPFWDIHCIHGHLRPPSFIRIDSQSAKGFQTHCRCVGQLLAQMMGIPWQQASIRPKGPCTTYLQDPTPFSPPYDSLHINTELLHVYSVAWSSYSMSTCLFALKTLLQQVHVIYHSHWEKYHINLVKSHFYL